MALPLRRLRAAILISSAFLLTSSSLFGQTLSLSSNVGLLGTNISLNLSFSASGSAPVSAMQWTITYSPSLLSAVVAVAGPAATSAGKTLSCVSGSNSYTCVLSGPNNTAIGSGVVAVVTAVQVLGTAPLGVTHAVGASPSGSAVSVTQIGGTVGPPSSSVVPQDLTCNPTTLASSASTSCVVTLSGAAPSGNAVVTLQDNSSYLTLPASVTVPAGSRSAAFSATTGSISTNQTAVITASLNGSSVTETLSLTAPAAVSISGLKCNSTDLSPGETTTCSVTLSGAAPGGGLYVTLSDNNAALYTQNGFTVPAGATSASFIISAGNTTSTQTATLTASAGGASRSISIRISPSTGPDTISFVQSAARSDNSSSLFLTQSFSSPNSAGNLIVVAISVDGLPSSLTAYDSQGNTYQVATGDCSPVSERCLGIFYARNIRSGPNTVTIRLGEGHSYRRIAVAEYSGVDTNSPLDVTAKNQGRYNTWPNGVTSTAAVTHAGGELIFGAVLDDDGTNNITAGTGFAQRASLNNDDFAIQDRVQGSAGSIASTQTFSVGHHYLAQMAAFRPAGYATQLTSNMLLETASAGGGSGSGRTAPQEAAAQVRPASLMCAKTVRAGESTTCEVRLDSSAESQPVSLAVTSSSQQVKVPALITTRPHQSAVRFRVAADAETTALEQSVVIAAQIGDTLVQDAIQVVSSPEPLLRVAAPGAAKIGETVRFQVAAYDPGGLTVVLSAADLPPGASFDAASGEFAWTPNPSQQGTYELAFTATNAAAQSSTKRVRIDVDTGKPALTASQPLACSPSADVRLTGKWLSPRDSASSDAAGETELGGTRVTVNSNAVPVLYSSLTDVWFQCPALDPGTPLEVTVETPAGATEPLRASMQQAAPTVLTLDGSGQGQGAVFLTGTSTLATSRDYLALGQPAGPGDTLSIWVTGLGSNSTPVVKLGDAAVTVTSVEPVDGYAGISAIQIQVPAGVPNAEALPLSVEVPQAGADTAKSNTVTIATENPDPAAQ